MIFPIDLITSIIPRVVNIIFIRNFTISRQLIQPIRDARINPPKKAIGIETPNLFIRIPQKHPVAYATAATDKSKIPASNAKIIAHVSRIIGAPFCKVLKKFEKVKKVSVTTEKKRRRIAKKM